REGIGFTPGERERSVATIDHLPGLPSNLWAAPLLARRHAKLRDRFFGFHIDNFSRNAQGLFEREGVFLLVCGDLLSSQIAVVLFANRERERLRRCGIPREPAFLIGGRVPFWAGLFWPKIL